MPTWDSWYSTTTASTTANLIWTNWSGGTGSTTITTTGSSYVWTYWQTQTPTRYIDTRSAAEVAAERVERERRAELRRARDRELAARYHAAEETAQELLRILLSDEQWAAWTEHREFEVTSSNGRTYLIRHGYQHNVFRIEDGARVEELCGHPAMSVYEDREDGTRERLGQLPTTDAVAAQVLALTTDEDAFREVANVWDLRTGRRLTHQSRRAA